jgi:hypothetical protein
VLVDVIVDDGSFVPVVDSVVVVLAVLLAGMMLDLVLEVLMAGNGRMTQGLRAHSTLRMEKDLTE